MQCISGDSAPTSFIARLLTFTIGERRKMGGERVGATLRNRYYEVKGKSKRGKERSESSRFGHIDGCNARYLVYHPVTRYIQREGTGGRDRYCSPVAVRSINDDRSTRERGAAATQRRFQV